MNKLRPETKVGILVVLTTVLALCFAWLLGIQNPFRSSLPIYVTYQFAGGIEVGSPVRVSGIKVGRVDAIDFFMPKDKNAPEGELIPVRLKLSLLEKAAKGIRSDSQFFVNLAGIIGERYIEITPGTPQGSPLQSGQTFVGVDPPRIDQLISQSFNLAGKVIEILNKNEGDITKSIELIYKLSENLNKLMINIEKTKIFKTDLSKLVENLIEITSHVKVFTQKIDSEDGRKTIELLHNLMWRLEPLDKKAIQEFFQKEGIRTKIF